ncbi:hypothetical protein EJB05_13059, partial [Eragrostis curvula]
MDEDYTRERLVASFMEVTGVVSTVDACDHLSCCGWNLDEAVNLFLYIGAGTSGSRSTPPSSSSVPDDADDDEENFMRAPAVVPARSSETPRGGRANYSDDRRGSSASGSSRRVSRWDSETRVSSSNNNSRSSRRRRRRERFRERGNDDEEDGDGGRRRLRARVGRDEDATRIEVDGDLTSRLQLYDEALNSGKNKAAAKKEKEEEKSLEDLFRPPHELTFSGEFHDAKAHAARRARWLLVNVQDTGEAALASFAQNRDVWASGLVAQFVRDHFVLWQADAADAEGQGAEAEEARKVCAHYGLPLDKLPAVLVVDPVTGQAMARLHGTSTDPNDFLVAVRAYIATKPVIPVIGAKKGDASADDPSNQQPATTTPASSQRTANRQDVPKVEKQDKAVPAVATVAPIVEKQDKAVAAVATVAQTVEKQRAVVPTVQPAPAPVPKVCKLRIRLPDGRTVTKEFASECPVAALFAYCRSELGEGEAAKKPFRLIRLVGCTREEIGDRSVSFETLGLHLSTVSVLLG